MPSAFEDLKARMHRQTPSKPGAWRERPQTDDQARASLLWCRRWLYELEYFGDGEWFATLRLAVRQRIDALERRLGVDADVPF